MENFGLQEETEGRNRKKQKPTQNAEENTAIRLRIVEKSGDVKTLLRIVSPQWKKPPLLDLHGSFLLSTSAQMIISLVYFWTFFQKVYAGDVSPAKFTKNVTFPPHDCKLFCRELQEIAELIIYFFKS